MGPREALVKGDSRRLSGLRYFERGLSRLAWVALVKHGSSTSGDGLALAFSDQGRDPAPFMEGIEVAGMLERTKVGLHWAAEA
jgi:hypothetical protein